MGRKRAKMRKKQKWIYESLIVKAEEVAERINRLQSEGVYLGFPVEVSPGELLNMAVAVGLSEIEKKLRDGAGAETEKADAVREKPSPEDSEFVKKLFGGI